ncbi:CMP6.5R [Camelpox virus CMS]|uniref:CMP6.5R n=1 Tax=Camelpox virus (strain CMS) TaxID=203172 RepID=Q8QQ85_CAMPS|nr:CMP6.5R [Camelpox virus CMS]
MNPQNTRAPKADRTSSTVSLCTNILKSPDKIKIHKVTNNPAPSLLKSLFDCRVYAVRARNTAVVSMKACITTCTS